VAKNKKDWVDKLVVALWAYKMAFKAPLGMSSYRMVYGRPCHLLIELKHRACWAIRAFHFDLNVTGEEIMLSWNEPEEFRREDSGNTWLSEE